MYSKVFLNKIAPYDKKATNKLTKMNKFPDVHAPKENQQKLLYLYKSRDLKAVIKYGNILIKDYPRDPLIYTLIGACSVNLDDLEMATTNFRVLCNLQPNQSEPHHNLGLVLVKQRRYDEAVTFLKRAIKLDPKSVKSLDTVSDILFGFQRDFEAIIYLKKLIKFNPTLIRPQINLGICFLRNFQFCKAKVQFSKVIKMDVGKDNCTKCLNYISEANLGLAEEFKKNCNPLKSIKYYKKCLSVQPNNSKALIHLGMSYLESEFKEKTHLKALRKIKTAVKLNNKSLTYNSNLLFALNYSTSLKAPKIYEYYKEFNRKFGIPREKYWKPFSQAKDLNKKLKIGYVSPDFRSHVMQYHLDPILDNHNKEKFEIYAFAELQKEDKVTQKYKEHTTLKNWVSTKGLSDKALAEKIRSLGIDILIDCAGHTNGNRLGAFMYKPAPVSLSWWVGYGYTSGISAIDYFLTDWTMAPKGSQHLFGEKLWRAHKAVSNCFRANPDMGEVGPLPSVSNGFVTFGTLTRPIRINSQVIKVWSEILKKTINSKLIINTHMLKHNKTIKNLKDKFFKNGVSGDRLDFYFESPAWDTMRQIDVALDCFPHNSGTTTLEHLYMGNPVITLAGRPSVGRIGASYLSTIGKQEWIAETKQDYIKKAVSIATNTQALKKIRANLREDMKKSPLMNEKHFLDKLENTYREMWQHWCRS